MAISASMNNQEESSKHFNDQHEHDLVMPGFRFHPTEEELVEFYLRRKIEGKKFNVQLITFLDLYRYDPWELPALAAIGEKEWYFYVPRDRKYRNGDRPNRVTTSGYWKATGADRSIRSENSRCIGLKKTLVFYSGKAPKGTRSCWIMNEYRLPHHEIERLHKGEISLCRVHKRAGVVEGRRQSLPPSLTAKSTPLLSSKPAQTHHESSHDQFPKLSETPPISTCSTINSSDSCRIPNSVEEELRDGMLLHDQPRHDHEPCCTNFSGGCSFEDLHRLVTAAYSEQAASSGLDQETNYQESQSVYHVSGYVPSSHFSALQPPRPDRMVHDAAAKEYRLLDWNGG